MVQIFALVSVNFSLFGIQPWYTALVYSEGWSTANYEAPPSNFIAGRHKAAFLFSFFSDFRCGVPLFLLYINIKIGKNRCQLLD